MCLFCDIVAEDVPADIVLAEHGCVAFLDIRPLQPGHCLLVPRSHIETIADVPAELIEPFFATGKRLAAAVEEAMEAEGTFMAINNRVSQSVPHLHLHVVPRKKGDGLRGFFWPRSRYRDGHSREVAGRIRASLEAMRA
jgi:histidine triad (HIT) family protein